MITIPEYSHKIWHLLRYFEFNKSDIKYDGGDLHFNPPTLYYKGVSARFLIDTDTEFINTDFCKCIISRNSLGPENSTEEDFQEWENYLRDSIMEAWKVMGVIINLKIYP